MGHALTTVRSVLNLINIDHGQADVNWLDNGGGE
jgi:hypothetical protein